MSANLFPLNCIRQVALTLEISNDFISIWNHLKSMKSLGLKPSVLFETTSLGWFQIELKSFEIIWNQWNPYVDLLWRVGDCISLISNDFISIWNHLKPMQSLGLKPSVLFETTSLGWFHWFQIELKSFKIIEINEILSNRNEINEIDMGKWFQTDLILL